MMVSFAESMKNSKRYLGERIEEGMWDIVRTQYSKFSSLNNKPIIPKKIHQIWFGGAVPSHLQTLVNKWVNLCEEHDWEYKLWTDYNVEEFDMANKEIFNKSNNLGQKSDIFRYEVLCKLGGIYVDIDFIPVKMFDDKLLSLDFFAGLAFTEKPILFNGLMGSSPNNKLIRKLADISEINNIGVEGVMETTGPYYLTREFLKTDQDNICALPVTYFYPYPNSEIDKFAGNNWSAYIKPETYCVHLWNCGWMRAGLVGKNFPRSIDND